MNLSLNLQSLTTPTNCSTFEELVAFVENESVPAGEVITRIVVDGEDIDEDRELELMSEPLGTISKVEIYTEKTIDLARQGIADARELLPALAEDLPYVSTELRSGNIRDGLELFGRCVEVLSWYVSLVTALDILFRRVSAGSELETEQATTAEELSPDDALAGYELDERLEPRTFASVENLRQKLLEVERAQGSNDAALLADLVEFELLPIVNLWNDELPLLSEVVRMEGASA
jgi:hypothetical protein